MPEPLTLSPIAVIRTDFPEKFGIPRQSGIVASLSGEIVFEPAFRNPDTLRGIEGFSHLWLIWEFSKSRGRGWSPTVRPPRLGGNARVGVFASRSPFRPNPLALSCVRLLGVDYDRPDGPVLLVSGADMVSGTPIFDIKPYLPYSDSHPDASGGFASDGAGRMLEADFPPALLERVPEEKRAALLGVLRADPRPPYQHDPEREYGLSFAGKNVRFVVDGDRLTVTGVDDLV